MEVVAIQQAFETCRKFTKENTNTKPITDKIRDLLHLMTSVVKRLLRADLVFYGTCKNVFTFPKNLAISPKWVWFCRM